MKQEEIASKLMCSQPTISTDIIYLRKDAEAFVKENRKHLAFEYSQVMSNLHQLRKKAWTHFENTEDDNVKLDLYEILEGINLSILNVMGAGDIIEAELLQSKKDYASKVREEIEGIESKQHQQQSQHSQALF